MKICILIPGNEVGGGVKMPVRLASVLAESHDITLMYPLVAHYTLYHKLQKTSRIRKIAYVAKVLYQQRRQFFFERDLSHRVRVRKYFLFPNEKVMQGFDVIIYVSVWQYHEIKSLDLKNVCKIHWSLADYLFSGFFESRINDILEAYCSGDIVVAPSELTRLNLERYGVQVRTVIHGGVDPIFNGQDRRWNFDIPRVLGYFQPKWWVKGAATLVQCIQQLRQKYNKIEVSLFGHQNSDIQKTGSVICDHFYTGLKSDEVAQLYRAHDIFVYPSYSDGFQSPPLEAMACGCAVVATRVGAVPEYTRDEQNALLCDPMDQEGLFLQVERLILDSNLRMRLSHQAIKDASIWTWEKCAAMFAKLLSEVA